MDITTANVNLYENPLRAQSLIDILSKDYNVTDESLLRVLAGLGEATALCADILNDAPLMHDDKHFGTQNASGDDQLHLDIDCDNAVFKALRQCGVVAMAASEETPVETVLSSDGIYSIGFDPLDGSSIIDANFAVGGIYGVWKSQKGVLGLTGRDQIASAISVYGPRTTLVVAIAKPPKSLELTLIHGRSHWKVTLPRIHLKEEGKIFAPGNLRASNDNVAYDNLVKYWIENRYTLRYSGGMVPDVYHMLIKGKGIFTNVSSEKSKAKLRLLYEVAPIGLIVEVSGGRAIHETDRGVEVLDVVIEDLDQRLGVCMGSSKEVDTYERFMFTTKTSTTGSTTL